jgi:hypothetical protein
MRSPCPDLCICAHYLKSHLCVQN